jgi:hypothetical protein
MHLFLWNSSSNDIEEESTLAPFIVKIDPATLFWILVLGFGVGAQRTLASLRRA